MQGPCAHELQQNPDVTLGEGLCCYLAILSREFIIMDGRASKQGRSSVGMALAGQAAGAPPEGFGVLSCQTWGHSQPPLCFVLQQLTSLRAVSLNSFLFCFAFWPRDSLKLRSFLKSRRWGGTENEIFFYVTLGYHDPRIIWNGTITFVVSCR